MYGYDRTIFGRDTTIYLESEGANCYYYYFILQKNSKITILTFMNIDGAFILAETRRKTSALLFVDNSMQIYLR